MVSGPYAYRTAEGTALALSQSLLTILYIEMTERELYHRLEVTRCY
jgi:hypothetical protein